MSNSLIYRVIETTPFRTNKMLNYIDGIGDADNMNTLYLFFGRKEPWSSRENESNYAPPYPTESLEYISTVWRDMLGALKIKREWIDPVIPRKDWGDMEFTDSRTFHIGDIVVSNTNSFNKTDDEIGWTVYKVVDVPDEGMCSIEELDNKGECMREGGIWTPSYESQTPPRGRGNAENIGDFKDGYIWEYMYTIPLDIAVNRCTNTYIIVPTPSELKNNPSRWGYDDYLTNRNNDYDLVYRLRATTLQFKAYLDSVYFPENALPNKNNSFRQISLTLNPLLKKESRFDLDKKATADHYQPDELMRGSGNMLMIQNNAPITRSLDQTEEITLIFKF